MSGDWSAAGVAIDHLPAGEFAEQDRRGAAQRGHVDQFCATVKPGRIEIFDIDDTFCAAHGGQQQLAFWNAHHDERGFASMRIYHVASGAPVAAILRPAHTKDRRNNKRISS
jgi:hypothetical protein